MSSESGDSRPACVHNNMGHHTPPKLVDPLPCPRCDSTSTKFCYYNNYNLSQPRHFCKACRRYWTHGGTLRNVPVGGGTRKNSKRCRSSSSSNSTSSSSTNTTASTLTHESESLPVTITNPESAIPVLKIESSDNLNLNENLKQTLAASENGNFLSLLNSQQGAGLMGMVGYGPGIGYGLCEYGVGFGGGRGSWACQGMGYFNGGGGGGTEGCNTWQVSDGEGGLVDGGGGGGECFSWPGLAISTTGKGLK